MKVLVECYADAALLHGLGVPKRRVQHESCKGDVVNRVIKLGCAIGLVDEDPSSAQPRALGNFREVEAAEELRLLTRRDDRNRRLILVCPRLENWLIRRARLCGIRPEDYGLPSDPDRLHSIPRYEQKEGFGRFLAALTERDRGMRLLRQWVRQAES